MRKYFAKWSPYRIRKVHVKLIGKNEIYRPDSELAGIDGTRDMYHFAERNVPKHDAATTTEGLKEDAKLVLKRDGGGRLSREEKRRLAELDKEKIAVMKDKGGWADVEPEEPISGEEGGYRQKNQETVPRKDPVGVLFLLLMSDLKLRGVPRHQDVPGYRSYVWVTRSSTLDCHVLKEFGICMIGILDRLY